MNMTSFGITDFKGCQRSKIMLISLSKADLFPKYEKIVYLLDIFNYLYIFLKKINLNANNINILFRSIFLCVQVTM